jgi:ribose-phosphate pyrophosphokinase
MSENYSYESILPIAPLKVAAMENCKELARDMDKYLVEFRQKSNQEFQDMPNFQGYHEDSYLIRCACPRFGTGEAKGILYDSVRGADLFILSDVTNHSLTYTVCGQENHMSPDDHYQDIKRIISAANGKAHRITVIMPFLYEGRQHKRTQRESLDCAFMLQELVNMGVTNIITFDAHDPRVCNAIPLYGFDNFKPPYQFIKGLVNSKSNLQIDKDHLMVVSPDEGAMDRAVYFAGVLGVEMGMFYKRRDYSIVVNGKNPIVAHEFLGDDPTGKDVIIIDDMISSGESMLDVAKQIKDRGARRVFICATFGLFTDGLDQFDEYYAKGYFDRVVTTNLTYRTPELLARPYYAEANMTKFLAAIIDCINHDVTTEHVNDPTERIRSLLSKMEQE